MSATFSKGCEGPRAQKRDLLPHSSLDEMLGSEVRPQVHNLPPPESNEQHGRANAKPLDPGVGALVRIPQCLLSRSEVVHLGDDFGNGLLDATEVGLDWLELLSRLDGGPILGVGANVDVELNVSDWVACYSAGWKRDVSNQWDDTVRSTTGGKPTAGEDVLKAYVECRIGM